MLKKILIFLLVIFVNLTSLKVFSSDEAENPGFGEIGIEPVDYVNPFIGTDIFSKGGAMAQGNTYPGAVVPFGMVQLSPDTGKNIAGYLYGDKYIEGFSHTHFSGTGVAGFGNVLVTAKTGELKTDEKGYRSSFSHDSEEASPGSYSVLLNDYGIKAELTATERAGMHRYTFPQSNNAHIILDASHILHDISNYVPVNTTLDALVNISPKEQLIRGYTKGLPPIAVGKTLTAYTLYFAARINHTFKQYGTWNGKHIYSKKNIEKGTDIGAYISFPTSKDEQIIVKVGISFVSEDQALLNLDTEIPYWDFDLIKNEARKKWNKALGKIVVEGNNEDNKIKFYTALYHAYLLPSIFSDVNGLYMGFEGGKHNGENDRVHIAKGYTQYSMFSLWDTFRAEHPLLTILVPEVQTDMIKSLISIYESGGWFPIWPFANRYTSIMIGDHSIPVIVDSYFKGINDFDVEKAYEGMKKNSLELPPVAHDFVGRMGLNLYKSLGYIPYNALDVDETLKAIFNPVKNPLLYQFVSQVMANIQCIAITLEYCYDDWCLARLAKALGKNDDYKLFMERSKYYRNVFDNNTKFMRPKSFNGHWMPLYNPENWYPGFTEGNAWTYSWFVPHDVQGLIELMGKDLFIDRLDHFFEKFIYPGWLSKFSQYWHGNEPDQHMPYLYDFVGQPWKTQSVVRRIMDELYGTGPSGIPGNDDCGQLSAWYVFSAMGFYPFCPGATYYTIGSPQFEKITIHLANGKDFVIKAINNADKSYYIKDAYLNGEKLEKTYFEHKDIIEGGTLIFEMRPEPSTGWGSKAAWE